MNSQPIEFRIYAERGCQDAIRHEAWRLENGSPGFKLFNNEKERQEGLRHVAYLLRGERTR